MSSKSPISQYTRWTLLSVLSGVLSGGAAAIFLFSLDWVTKTRDGHPSIIWLLPFAGLFIGWAYHRFGKDIAGGNNLIIEEIHNPKKTLPVHMAPFVLLGTLLTHLFGGSAGREGTAVQMGASLSDQLHRFFPIEPEERKILLASGASAGFGAAIGAPWAGVIFGMEVIQVGRFRPFAWFQCLVASFIGFDLVKWLGAPHSQYPLPKIPELSVQILLWVALAGAVFGLAAKVFSMTTHAVERVSNHFIKYPPLKTFFGGLLLVALFYLEGSYRYVGLGIPHIQSALENVSSFGDPILKSLFTSLTIGTGFKGGEFIPLVFIGTTLGSALSVLIPVGFSLLAALGFAAVFGGASNTPIACTIMAMEIFGPRIGPLAFIACFMSYFFSGHHGIYKSQRIHAKKHKTLFSWLSKFGTRARP